jgi:cyanophycin synthetase
MVAQSIARPLHEQGGAIVEVNAGPGLLMHLKPAVGAPRPVGQAIVEHLFPAEEQDGEAGRIPVVGVAGTRDSATIARLVAWLLHLSGRHTGVACRDGLFLDRRRVEAADSAHWEAAHRLLMNKTVRAVVIENDARTILRDGLAYDRCQVGVVTDMDGMETLAAFDVHTQEQMTRVLRTQVDVVLPSGAAVLHAAIAQVVELAPLCDGSVVLYAQDAGLAAIAEHRARDNGRAVFLKNGRVVLATGNAEHALGALGDLTFGRNAVVPDTDALLAAVATAWALDIAPDLIGAGIKTFEPELHAQETLRT